MLKGVTAVSTLRDDLTFIVNVSFPLYFSTILSFSKLLPINLRIHEDSRTFKNIQGLVNTLDIPESS